MKRFKIPDLRFKNFFLDKRRYFRIMEVMLLTVSRIKNLSAISRDIGQVLFASVFVEPIIKGSLDSKTTFAGLLLTLVSWQASVILAK